MNTWGGILVQFTVISQKIVGKSIEGQVLQNYIHTVNAFYTYNWPLLTRTYTSCRCTHTQPGSLLYIYSQPDAHIHTQTAAVHTHNRGLHDHCTYTNNLVPYTYPPIIYTDSHIGLWLHIHSGHLFSQTLLDVNAPFKFSGLNPDL